MNLLKLPLAFLLLISTALAIPVAGQQKRRTPEKTPAKAPAAPAPAPPTFDTLLAADSFKVYGEIRGVGQLIRSNAANEILEPILKLGSPPKDFTDLVNWLRSHADQLMTSRLLVAGWPTLNDVPYIVIAIEFSSTDEAAKFESQLNGLLPRILPPLTPEPVKTPEQPITGTIKDTPGPTTGATPSPTTAATPSATLSPTPPAPAPRYYLQRADSLLILSQTPLQLKKLRPKGSKLLSEDPNFRVAYNRFSSEPVFVFFDFKAIQKEEEERNKLYEEERKKAEEAQEAAAEKRKAEGEQEAEVVDAVTSIERTLDSRLQPPPEAPAESPSEEALQAAQLSTAVSMLQYSLFVRTPDLPDALGIGFTPDNESFDARALMIDSAGETSDPIPFFSGLKLGAPISPQSASILPADSQLVVTMSLDFPQLHTRMLTEVPPPYLRPLNIGNQAESETPLATVERLLKIKLKDELLPALGSEVTLSLPMTSFSLFGLPRPQPQPQPQPDASDPKAAPRSPLVVISLRDKEAVRQFMPKLLAGFGGKAATLLAQTERRGDTEIISYANAFAYAFVGDFLVLSRDAATTRHVVDSYLKGETLAADPQFKNSMRWQPRQVQGQVYISPAIAESYKTWANSPTSYLSEEVRAFVTRLSTTAQPITYSLSNDGLGALHELHVPKNLVLLAVSGIASSENPPETVKNERAAMGVLWSISYAQRRYKEEKGSPSYASLEQLLEAQMVSKDMIEASGYKYEIMVSADGFAISAVPVEYGKTGKLSFYLDQSGTIRGADRGGAAATASDHPIAY